MASSDGSIQLQADIRASQALGHWFESPNDISVEPLGNAGGLSGALLWKVEVAGESFCLRRWPAEQPTLQKLGQIHAFQTHLSGCFPQLVPRPIVHRGSATIVDLDDRLWELTSWVSGAACDEAHCSNEKIAAAATALAQLHRAADKFMIPGNKHPQRAASRGIHQRLDEVRALQRGKLAELGDAIGSRKESPLVLAARRAHHALPAALPLAVAELQRCASLSLPQQWRLGDVRGEHVLFTGDKVTGIVDYGAAGVDSAAGDAARLLGSLAGDDPVRWGLGLRAYETIRPLSTGERRTIAAFDAGGLCASVSKWLTWIFVNQRTFAPTRPVEQRLGFLAGRLEALNLRGHASVIDSGVSRRLGLESDVDR